MPTRALCPPFRRCDLAVSRSRWHRRRALTVLRFLSCVFSLAIGAAPAHAEAPRRACGTSDGSAREPVASDSLFVLRAAVGISGTCGHCLCDVNDSGGIGAADALAVLRRAVDGQTPLPC